MAGGAPTKLDVIVPVYNEGESILAVLRLLNDQCATPCTIHICYDFDEDDTLAALKQYAGRIPLNLVKNEGRGPHGAIMTGFRKTSSKVVVVFPADDTLNAGILDEMYRKIEAGAEICAACRFMPGGKMENCPWLKDLLVRAASLTLHHLAGLPIRDASNGFRMFSRRVIETIPIQSDKGFTYSLELTVKSHRLGWPMAEVPAHWRERLRGKSRFKVYRWLFPYLRWYFYAFATTWLFQRKVKGVQPASAEAGASRNA